MIHLSRTQGVPADKGCAFLARLTATYTNGDIYPVTNKHNLTKIGNQRWEVTFSDIYFIWVLFTDLAVKGTYAQTSRQALLVRLTELHFTICNIARAGKGIPWEREK